MEKKWNELEIDVAKKIWTIAGISPEYGNAVMDVIGEEAYQNVMNLQDNYNLTNGDVVKAMFPNAEIEEIRSCVDKDKLLGYKIWLDGHYHEYHLDWWNDEHNGGLEEDY